MQFQNLQMLLENQKKQIVRKGEKGKLFKPTLLHEHKFQISIFRNWWTSIKIC